MATAMYKVEKVSGEWSVINKEDGEVVATAPSRDKARQSKKEFEVAYLEAVASESIVEASTDSPTEEPIEIEEAEIIEADLDSQMADMETEGSEETAAPAKPKAKRTRKPKEAVKAVEVGNMEKVEVVTRSNYASNMARAKEIQDVMVKHYKATGGFPSHRLMRKQFEVSFKALIRHRRTVKVKFLGLEADAVVETTESLPRTKKADK